MKRAFHKRATTWQEQVDLLLSRGRQIDDPRQAAFYLQHLQYYRLAAYWLPFEADHQQHLFREGTQFAQVLDLYIFDRELRLMMMDAIERIEVSVRSQWAYHLAHLHGPHAHLDPSLAVKRHLWESNLDKLLREVERSDEIFIRHLRATYMEDLPPVWAVCEVMSLGLLSRWYDCLRPMRTRRAIASSYGLDDEILASWLRHLSLVRNVCAHHGRLWNREFTVIPILPKRRPQAVASIVVRNSRKLYNTVALIDTMLDTICPANEWLPRLEKLLEGRHYAKNMGFPEDWQHRLARRSKL